MLAWSRGFAPPVGAKRKSMTLSSLLKVGRRSVSPTPRIDIPCRRVQPEIESRSPATVSCFFVRSRCRLNLPGYLNE